MSTDKHWWASGCGRIELRVPQAVLDDVCHPGPNDAAVLVASQQADLRDQLENLNPLTVRSVLRDYGAWDEQELQDHKQNIQRLLWIAAWDLFDETGAGD